MSSLSPSVATSLTVLKESSAQNVPKPQSPSANSLPRSGQEPLKHAGPLAEHTRCKSQGEYKSQTIQEILDIILPSMSINPQLLIKRPRAPRSAGPKKRMREGDTVVDPGTLKRARTEQHQAAAGVPLDCPWPGCQTRGIAVALWGHLQHDHAQGGKYPLPQDYVQCGWDGCLFSGPSDDIIAHFEDQHNIGHNGYGTHVSESREKENVEGAASSAKPQDKRVVCKMADCGVEVQRGRSFRRHVYGGHWHHADYHSWCEFCGSWKRRDQNCEWRAHQEKCIRDHLEDYGPQPTTVENVGAW